MKLLLPSTLKIRTYLLIMMVFVATGFNACAQDPDVMQPPGTQTTHLEQYRPQLHFSPESGWMNDPNGLIYAGGTWNLYHQYIPGPYVIDQMNWGHAVSTDLVHWKYKPVAITTNTELGMAYSGSAIVDPGNTSGLCDSPASCVLAFFTHSQILGGDQKQSVAVSNDAGLTFEEYAGNPIMPNPDKKDFRDPKVFWYSGTEGAAGAGTASNAGVVADPVPGHWVMVLAEGKSIGFYSSVNLLEWQPLSTINNSPDWEGGVWECPDLFPLSVENEDRVTKWILMTGVFSGAPAGGSGVHYIVGTFDGTTFTPDDNPAAAVWLDAGWDFYAAQSFSNVPTADGRRIILAWMNNWNYALNIPTTPWQGSMALPRQLTLQRETDGSCRIHQAPIDEIVDLRRGRALKFNDLMINENELLIYTSETGLYEINVTGASAGGKWALRLESGGMSLEIGVDNTNLYIDRTNAICDECPAVMKRVASTPLDADSDTTTLKIFVDHSGVEVFADAGRTTMTALAFLPGPTWDIKVVAPDSYSIIYDFELWELFSMWAER